MVGPNFVKTIRIFKLLVFLGFLFSFQSTIYNNLEDVTSIYKKVINETTGFPVTNVLSFTVKSCMFCN